MALAVGVSSNSASSFRAPKSKRMRAMRLPFCDFVAPAITHFHDCEELGKGTDARGPRSHFFGFRESRKNRACSCNKSDTHEADELKIFVAEQKSADA